VVRIEDGIDTDFSADNGAGLLSRYAKSGLVPPCTSDFTSPTCNEPGHSLWSASFCSKDEITISMAQSPRAAALTFLNLIVGQIVPLYDVDKMQALITELEIKVPSFADAIQCVSPITVGSFGCASTSISQLASKPDQLRKMQESLKKFGVDLTLDELIKRVLNTSSGLLNGAADEILYVNRTLQLHTYPFVTIGISGK
jgi:hypothetical protein